MTPSTLSRHAPRMLLAVLLHLLVMYLFLQSQTVTLVEPAEPQGPRIQWLRAVAPEVIPPPARPVGKPEAPAAVRRIPARHTVAAPISAPAQVAPAAPELVAEPAPSSPVPPSAADILAQAKRDIGKIDKDLRKEFPVRGMQKQESTAFQRMQQGFEQAYAAVPPKWYEASRIEEIGADDRSGVRVYKITSALGSICVSTIPGRGGETAIGMCPK